MRNNAATVVEEGISDFDVEAPEEQLLYNCNKVLMAGMWLIRNGYGRMMLLPYAAPSGCFWRCEFHPPLKPSKAFYRYSTSTNHRYLENHCGGSIRRDVSPEKLATAIMVSVPEEMKERCRGEASTECLRWLDELERVLSQKYVPQAFHDYTQDYSHWELVNLHGAEKLTMRPQPGYMKPGDEPHWTAEPFWREALSNWSDLLHHEEFLFSTKAIEDGLSTHPIAVELARAMKDVSEDDADRLFKAAIAALYDSFQYKPDPSN